MTLADDTVAIIGPWSETLTIVRRSSSFSGRVNTVTWTSQGTFLGDIQPVSGSTISLEIGDKIKTTHEIYGPDALDVQATDRIRLAGFSSGDNEYEVKRVEDEDPSHTKIFAVLTRGHGG